MKCKIKWVCKESNWQPTPDDNQAIALAYMETACDQNPLPICQDHLDFAIRERLELGTWQFFPLANPMSRLEVI